MRFNDIFRPVAAIVLTLSVALPAMAQQQTGALEGTVEGPDGAALSGATVTIGGAASIGGDRTETTNENGEFRFLKLLPGEYKITIKAEGFEGLTTTMRIGIGKTQRLKAPLAKKADEGTEVIEVEAQSLAVDSQKVDVSTNFTAEFLQAVPSGRSYQGVTQFTPGVSGGGNPNIGGGSDSSNAYLIDGVDTTDPTTNTFSLNFNFDAIEELQVMTGGFHPRYGNVTGGVINVVTKSGSNEFELDTSVYYNSRLLQVESPDEELVPDDLKRNFWDVSANLNVGGPIIDDRLWYYISAEYNYVVSQLPASSPIPALDGIQHPERVFQGFYWLAKFTAQLDPNNRLQFMAQADPATIDNASQDPEWAKESEYHQDQGGFTGKIDWDADYDPLLIKVRAAYKRSMLDVFPQERVKSSSPFRFPGVLGWGEFSDKNSFGISPGCLGEGDRADPATFAEGNCTSDVQDHPEFGNGLHFDADTGMIYGGISFDSFIIRERTQVDTELSYFLDDVGGDHQIDLGFQLALKSDESTSRDPGGASVFVDFDQDGDGTPDPYFARVVSSDDNELTQKADGQVMAFYLADTWTFADRFTLQPGVRVEQATHENFKGEAALDFFVISPRVGFSIDPFADGRTRIYGGYARLYETGNLALSKFVGTSLQTRLAFWNGADADGEDNDGDGEVDEQDEGRYVENPASIQSRGGESGTTVDPDLEPMYTDEFRLGIERALGDDWALGVSYKYRDTRQAWEDDEINLIWNQAGSDIIGSYAGDGQQIFRLTTIAEAQRKFQSVEATLKRSSKDGWGFNGSYTLAWSTGTTSEYLTAAFDNPRQNSYLDGPLGSDIRHNVKLQGFKKWDSGLQLGAAYRFESGTPYSAFYQDIANESYVLRRAPRGRHPGNDINDPLDDRFLRLPDFTRLDVRFAWDFEPLLDQKLMFMVDIFNVMNLNSVTGVYANEGASVTFGEPTNYQSPLRVQLGLRYQY